jgi:uncharacterized protein (TIRG00374 family)
LKKYLKFILLFLFAVFIFWFFGRGLDWAEISDKLGQADGLYLFTATIIICFGYFLRSLRWRTLLKPITETSLRELFAATTVGFSVILIIGRAGEIVRPMWLSMRDHRVRPSTGLITLAVERVCDMVALICFFAVGLVWLKPPTGHENEFAYVRFVGILMLIGVVFGIIALWLYQKFSPQVIGWFEGKTDRRFIPKRVRSVFLSLLEQLAVSLGVFRDWREVVAVVGWTIAVWLGIAIPTWLIILAFGIQMSFVDSLFVMFVAAIGSVVPTPGGAAGAFHAATAAGLIFFDVGREQAAAVSIAMHIIYFAPAVIFGIYYFLRGDVSLKRLRSLISSEHAVEEIESESPNRKIEFQSTN